MIRDYITKSNARASSSNEITSIVRQCMHVMARLMQSPHVTMTKVSSTFYVTNTLFLTSLYCNPAPGSHSSDGIWQITDKVSIARESPANHKDIIIPGLLAANQ